jgi:hypothetical protein
MLRAILESAAQGILAVNDQGLIVVANPRIEELFGYDREELFGRPVELLLPPAAKGRHEQHRRTFSEAPHARPMGVGMDLAGVKKDGTEFPVEISLSYLRSESGLIAIAFISDISHRKRLEEQVLQSQKMEAVGRLAGGIAHDFNNLLTIITGYDQLLLNTLSPFEPMRGYAEEIAKAAERAASLTKQLLAFSRRQIIAPRVLSPNLVVAEMESMLRRLITENIDLVFVLRPNTGNVKADRSQFEQILVNLVINSRDACENGGRITIESGNVELDEEYSRTHLGVKPGPYVMLAVSDTGVGMDPETRSHIFEPFFTTKSQDKGTGLGLATVYGVVKQNGGDIWVYSEVGRGTTFKVYLPRVSSSAEGKVVESTSPERGHETVLVVEDEQGVRSLIVQILRGHGYHVMDASDALAGLQVAETYLEEIQLLITDVVMPHSSGHELAEQIRVKRPGIRVLYISGYTENTVVHHGVMDSEIEFLPKPFTFEALLARVREVLDRT